VKVLLLSAYDADSHKRWRLGLEAAIPDWQWTILTLPPRYFSWRIRGNSLSWGRGEARTILERDWDLILATSMTDLSALRGLVPKIASVPTAVYFHENQFAYPRSTGAFASVEPQLLNIYTALCGDLLLFNSEYNRRTLLEGAGELLKRFPDCVPGGLCEEIAAKSEILPVPLEEQVFALGNAGPARAACSWKHRWEHGYRGMPGEKTLIISWAARWEYDKGADRLLQILHELEKAGVDYRLNLLGQSFRNSPEEFAEIQSRFAHRLLVVGYIDDANLYRETLGNSQLFLSTAYHEFQGLAVMEAVAAGSCPLVPDEQAYPEYYANKFRYKSVADAVNRIKTLAQLRAAGAPLPAVDLSALSWRALEPDYRRLLQELANRR
jgi:glycosyltransferase involved in cell wall biosynthesis